MIALNRFFERIGKDFRQKELVPLKIIFFVQASTLYVLYPYLTIHMRELGINVEETAIMSSITPLVAMIMPPLAGMLADRIGNFRILLSVFSAFGGLAALLLLLVPIGRMTVHFPERIVMDLGCQGDSAGSLFHTMSQTHPCETKLRPEITMRVESCGFVCRVEAGNETDAILKSKFYIVRHSDSRIGVNISYKYTVAHADLSTSTEQEDMKEHRQMRNNEFFKTAIRRISKTRYFFPADQLFSFACVPSDEHAQDNIDNFTSSTREMYKHLTSCSFGRLITPENNVDRTINYHLYKSKIKNLEPNEEDSREERARYSVEGVSWIGENFQKPVCDNLDDDDTINRIAIDARLYDSDAKTMSTPPRILSASACDKRCVVTAPRNEICSNMNVQVEHNVSLTFWLYLVIRVFIGIIGGTTFAMFEGAVIAILREQDADYGLQRIYGTIGGMISSPLSGLLIDYASRGKGYTDFRPAFYLYAALKVVGGVLMLLINLEFKAPATNVVRDVFIVLRNIETAALFLTCFILGTAWGYIESFLFWLIQDLGGSKSLMGITITVGGIAGIPLLALSGPIISRLGHANVIFIGFVFYAIRLLGYSLVYNAWLMLIFEALESVTSSLSFTAAVTYAAKLSTTSTDSSIQGLLGGVYYGVGKGSGSLIGGYLMKAFGTRPTYRIFAVMTLVTGVMYFIFNITYLRKRSRLDRNDLEKQKPKEQSRNDSLDKSANEIGLNEKPQDLEQINDNKDNDADNEFSEKTRNNKTSTNERGSLKRIESLRNAKNEQQNPSPRESEAASDEKNCFANPTFDTDSSDRCEITERNQRTDDKLTDREFNSQL
ncbi:major facilitator superfamily domain-containing protein 6 [Pseudomyrmex gracilis]|uniref:major facilitator superfamily domain-containing protein 6 n=1 Tax=Pseudomyrmex gracilis TaxID=219809 RepID=UPI000995967D|nr:major facilitator superfamily domain-containing protein 6 [Pseudomyrmex gracilis]